MSRSMLRIALLGLLAAAFAGCGELEQSANYKDGKYRGKPDGRPWESQPTADARGEWRKGDHDGWQRQMRTRSEGQNESRRIGH